jgi:hypothetical protein
MDESNECLNEEVKEPPAKKKKTAKKGGPEDIPS